MQIEKVAEMLLLPAATFAASYGGIRTALSFLIKRVDGVESKVDVIQRDVSETKERVAHLEGSLGVG
jgi:hypothetical protein